MEWLILLLIVPAIVVPIVLLCGFAGCHFQPAPVDGGSNPPPAVMPPTVNPPEPKNVDHITVSWQNADPSPALHYHFVRLKGTQTPPDFQTDTTDTSREDTGLETGTDYTYQVSTTTAVDTSTLSMGVPTRTFQATFEAGAVATNQPNFAGDYCFVQRISASKLLASGDKVAFQVRGAPASNVTINRIYVSQVGAGNPWNSAGDLAPVMTSPLTLPDAQPKDLDGIVYNLDKSQDLIIAFDFTAAAGADTIAYVSPQPGVTLYFKQGVQQASVPIRGPGYSTGPSQIYLVVTIGVP